MRHAVLGLVLAGCWIAPDEPPVPDREWHKVMTTGETPELMNDPRGTYDSKRERIVYYGGRSGGVPAVNNFAYADGAWFDPCPGCTPPGPRIAAAFAYDSRRDRYVLAGGSSVASDPPAPDALDEVWELDPNKNTWTLVGKLPEPRVAGHLIDDTVRGTLVLLGGSNANGVVNKIYDYDGTTWRARDVGPARPMGVGGLGTTVTFDSQFGRILALVDLRDFDGGATEFDELWELTDRWRRLCTDCSMIKRKGASLIWVPRDGWTYLIAGYSNGDEIGGTMRFDETTQRFIDVDPLNPGPRDSSAVVYYPKEDAVILYGGNGTACINGDCDEVLAFARR